MINCGSKGFLSFLILWLGKQATNDRRTNHHRTSKKYAENGPSPGTIYPVLKHLNETNILAIDKDKRYSLTEKRPKNSRRTP